MHKNIQHIEHRSFKRKKQSGKIIHITIKSPKINRSNHSISQTYTIPRKQETISSKTSINRKSIHSTKSSKVTPTQVINNKYAHKIKFNHKICRI